MGSEPTVDILGQAIALLFSISLPLLLVGLLVGVTISLVQAATQVQEASLVFVPKLIAVVCTFWAIAPWIGERVIGFCRQIFLHIAEIGAGGGLI